MPRLNKTVRERIEARVSVTETECWIWQLGSDRHGYGRMKVSGKEMLAHRASYEAFVGKIPEGLTIDHLCRVPLCVNPSHLEPVSNKENILRSDGITAKASRQTHCKAGHLLSGENLYLFKGHRHCRACNAARSMKYKSALNGGSNV